MGNSSVLLLDDDDDLRAVLYELFAGQGVDCLAAGSVEELKALGPSALACRLALLDLDLGVGGGSGAGAYEWLTAHRFTGRVVFLTGYAKSHPQVATACELGVEVLEKPVRATELLDLLEPERGAADV